MVVIFQVVFVMLDHRCNDGLTIVGNGASESDVKHRATTCGITCNIQSSGENRNDLARIFSQECFQLLDVIVLRHRL